MSNNSNNDTGYDVIQDTDLRGFHPYIVDILRLMKDPTDGLYYKTPQLAKKIFSNACVDYCRNIVGLPKINWR